MQQVMAMWRGFDTRRRVIIIGATVLVFGAVLVLSGMAAKPRLALLYAGMEPAQAGQIMSALDQRGVVYEVKGDSIWVDAGARDGLRMQLASDGLPEAGAKGYEILDTLSGFGTTSQMFDAAYWRAREGELARTILANHEVKTARVHIATPVGQGFRPGGRPTAAVTVTTTNGGLSAPQAKALKYLVSSSVAGMRPEDVSIIDSVAGLISAGDENVSQSNDVKAAELRKNAERVLAARVGYGNAVVEVAVETVTEHEAVTERRIDPQSRVAISVDSEERKSQDNNQRGGATTVASNLPEGQGANDSNSQSQDNTTRERTNYEISETTREVVRNPGDIRRLSVAVLVDGVDQADETGNIVNLPRTDEEMASLRELVASSVGLDEARGDVLTIRSMSFMPTVARGTEVSRGFMSQGLDMMRLIEMAVIALVALVLGLFVVRPMITQRRQAANDAVGLPAPTLDNSATPVPDLVMPAFNMADISLPGEDKPAPDNDPVSRLRHLIQQRQAESSEVLRSWVEAPQRRE